MEELRDLFTLHEGVACQTHDLMQCECSAKSSASTTIDENIPADNKVSVNTQHQQQPPTKKRKPLALARAKKETGTAHGLKRSALAKDWLHFSAVGGERLTTYDPVLAGYLREGDGEKEVASMPTMPITFVMLKHTSTADDHPMNHAGINDDPEVIDEETTATVDESDD